MDLIAKPHCITFLTFNRVNVEIVFDFVVKVYRLHFSQERSKGKPV